MTGQSDPKAEATSADEIAVEPQGSEADRLEQATPTSPREPSPQSTDTPREETADGSVADNIEQDTGATSNVPPSGG